jgi:anaerobic magnesium-protoporphyrin IX monomethyl ester cyclase
MKVLFIWPNFDCPVGPSIGVSYLSAALKQAGHETKCLHICEWLDYPFDVERATADAAAYDPGLIAVSSGTNHYPDCKLLAEAFKSAMPETPIIFGGMHTTLNVQEVIGVPWIDFANVGEGDDSIVELANALENGGNPLSIPGIWAKTNGTIHRNMMRRSKDISKLPYMDTDIWQYERIMGLRRGWVNVYFNRGCPYRCTYCHNNGEAKIMQQHYGTRTASNDEIGFLRYRDPDDMIGELKHLMGKYDVKAFSFNDDTFTMNKEQMLEFLPRYRDEIGLPWVCNTTVLDVDREILTLMKEAGCDLVRFGVESATDRVKKKILKRAFSNTVTRETFSICREIDLRTFAYIILGNPTETREEMLDTLRLMADLLTDGFKVSLGYPYPGTEYHDIAKELDLIDDDYPNFHNFIRESKMKWSDEDRVWIDKVRAVPWWYINMNLDKPGVSPIYREMVEILESIPEDDWWRPETEQRMLDMDEAVSRTMQMRGLSHYAIPFKDRPEISLLLRGRDYLSKETLDPH